MKKLARFAPVLLLFAAACAPIARDVAEVPATEAPRIEVADRAAVKFGSAAEAAQAATSSDPAVAAAAVAHLRALGPAGMKAMNEAHHAEVAHGLGEGPATLAADPAKVFAAMDAVSGSRDGWASGLYWYTDADAAMAAAAEQNKPILNLWLLGRLDDEFC